MRLLVIEDEEDLARAIAKGLRRHGHAVDHAGTIADAELKITSGSYDLLVVDWNLPDGSGVELCARIRDRDLTTLDDRIPKILILTARDDVEDRVTGLDAGADDYLVKPFAFVELEARVRALLRRDDGGSPVLSVAGVQLDPAKFVAVRHEKPLDLTVKEFALLEYFLRHPDEVLSQERLLEHVWDEMADPFTNTVRVTISNLRKKLGLPPLIETVSGRGYVVRSVGTEV